MRILGIALNLAVPELDNPARMQGNILLMRNYNHRIPLSVNLFKQPHYLNGGLCIKVSRRLIRQDD